MILRFCLGVGHTGERVEESILRLHVDQLDAELTSERLFDLLALVLSHESRVDEDAGQLLPDGLGDERRRDGRVDAARERAEDLLVCRPVRGSPRPGLR